MRLRISVALGIVAIIFSVLSLLYWDFIRDVIVTPVYYLLWLADLMLKSIPQEVFLVLLIVISIIIGLSTLEKIRAKVPVQERERNRSAGVSRYLEWKRLCEIQDSNQFVRNQFTWETRKLILALIAYQEGVDAATAEEMVKNGDLAVPDRVRILMQRREVPVSDKVQNSLKNPFLRLRQMLLGGNAANEPQIDPLAEEIVAFIEQCLEINHVGNQPEE